ncbi:MAG: cyclic pyranopterin monophosphate synthase MoaC [Clostridiales Family XIII bacterium]|nr:cyclic pyranopterin monophosphate synthase MoaC [Clostridiales Family XIII bacterium]
MADNLTHIDAAGNALMVDVSEKPETKRKAVAAGRIVMKPETFERIAGGTAPKGDVLAVARVAGIMAAKRTQELIPLCHPLMTEKCTVDFIPHREISAIEARCTVFVTGKTGVEMEALTGVSIALLTIYDMCKAMDRGMEIGDIALLEKRGGKSGVYIKE